MVEVQLSDHLGLQAPIQVEAEVGFVVPAGRLVLADLVPAVELPAYA